KAVYKRASYASDKDSIWQKLPYTFLKWIEEGGFSADEPEYYMSLRHFYDPTNPIQPYLTDLVTGYSIVMKEDNPEIDAREWALRHSSNDYCWNRGVSYINDATQYEWSYDPEDLFAAAWRSLGETMHLIADMTVPAHVRNDSHPASAAWYHNDLRADAYEYIVSGKTDLIGFSMKNALISQEMIAGINNAADPDRLFELVAGHVNSHFFSPDTIPYKNFFGSTVDSNGGSVYSEPLLDNCAYEDGTYYIVDFPGEKLLMAHDTWVDSNGWDKNPPIQTYDVVASQARRLIPIAVRSCAKLADLFIPRMMLRIDEPDFDNKVITGNLALLEKGPDGFYKPSGRKIAAAQKMIIFFDVQYKEQLDKLARLAPPVSIGADGSFTIPLDEVLNTDDLDKALYPDKYNSGIRPEEIRISLGVDFGGIFIKSNSVNESTSFDFNSGSIKLSLYPVCRTISTNDPVIADLGNVWVPGNMEYNYPVFNGDLSSMVPGNTKNMGDFVWSGNEFTSMCRIKDNTSGVKHDYTVTVKGALSNDGKTLTTLKLDLAGSASAEDGSGKDELIHRITLANIPAVSVESLMASSGGDVKYDEGCAGKALAFQMKGSALKSHLQDIYIECKRRGYDTAGNVNYYFDYSITEFDWTQTAPLPDVTIVFGCGDVFGINW
ncbi:MAG: hypothetical protein PHG48_08535, partial [Eubacteriales bacterium]|nr:hypothetical protein [Eubacteriales bacterium]